MIDELHSKVLTEVAKRTGKVVPAAFIKNTSIHIEGIERLHNLIKGIFKPVWSNYALSIVVKIDSPYKDKDDVVFLDDGRWLMTYSPRAGGLEISDNQALVKCMQDNIPLAVFQQITDKTNRQYGSTYRILGLGLITSYDASKDVFIVEGVDTVSVEKIAKKVPEEERYEVQLYSQLNNEFMPFTKEESTNYKVNKSKRNSAFRKIVLREYDNACVVCERKFQLDSLVEAQAAHIVSKSSQGTDDPRNGLALCRNHHWAFDSGLFTITDNYTIQLSQRIKQATTNKFSLLEMDSKPILKPINDVLKPHSTALAWHRENIWLQ